MPRRTLPLEQQKRDFTAEGAPPPGLVSGAVPALPGDTPRVPAAPPRPVQRRPTLHRPRRTAP